MSGLKRRLGPISILSVAAVFVILGTAGCSSIGSMGLQGAGAVAEAENRRLMVVRQL